MKNIPIWQHKLKTIQSNQQPSLSAYTLPASQLYPIYIDHSYEIYTSTSTSRCNEHACVYQQAYNSASSSGGGSNGQYDSGRQCSLVHDRRYGRMVWVDLPIYACVMVDDSYCLFTEDLSSRYTVVRTHHTDLIETLKSMGKSMSAQGEDILENGYTGKDIDTKIKPLRKINGYMCVYGGNVYVAGCHPVHQWQLTSPLWMYSCQDDGWQQVNLVRQKKPKTITNANGQFGRCQDWIFVMEGMIIYVTNRTVRVQSINGEYHKQITLTNDKQPMINTHTDTYLTCTYKNNQTGSNNLLLLIQTKSTSRYPILLQISLVFSVKIKSKMSEDGKVKAKNNGNTDKYAIQVEVLRYDLGVFLGDSAQTPYTFDRTQKLNTSTSSINGDANIVNEAVYMQVADQGASPILHTMSTTSQSNFIKKGQSQPLKHTTKKVQVLTLFTKTRKNSQNPNNPYIQLDTYSIKLSHLEKTQLNSTNKPLSYYFQKKQYCDLIFLAQKRQVLCNRQLFQFYSSKFKKLYSNCSNSRTEPQQQQQTLVKLDNTKLSTIYFLVQHLYHNFSISLKGFDETMLIDLMILSHKFQIIEMQVLCEQEVQFSCENFNKLYDYFRNSETHRFREQFLKFFIIHAQDVMKIMPIGKVEELIRLVYSPQCTHTNHTEVKAKLENNYSIKDSETGQSKQFQKSINYANIIKSQQVVLKICLKCSRLLTFNHETHRKNKSSVRGTSLGSFGHKKKDNKSN